MISSIKPLDTELVLTSTRRTEAIVTVEENSTFGLGSAVATVFAASKRSSLRTRGKNLLIFFLARICSC